MTNMVTNFLRLCFLTASVMLLSACSSAVSPEDQTAPPQQISDAQPVAPSFPPPRQIALLLPQTGAFSTAGKAIQAGFMAMYQGFSPQPVIKMYDQNSYDQAVQDGANYIVGPLEKNKVAALENRGDIKVLTIALNNPDTSSAINPLPQNLYEFSLSPAQEAEQIADKAAADGYQSALMITPEGAWGQNIANALQQRFQADGGTITGSIAVNQASSLDTQIQQLLEIQNNTRRQDFDVIFLIVNPGLARQIRPLLKYYHAENIPVYSTSLVYSGLANPGKDNTLNGIIFCDMPFVLDQTGPWSGVRAKMMNTQPLAIQQYIRLYALGWDAAYLTQHFGELHAGIYGAVGQLSLSPQHHILRKLTFAAFTNGQPEILPQNEKGAGS